LTINDQEYDGSGPVSITLITQYQLQDLYDDVNSNLFNMYTKNDVDELLTYKSDDGHTHGIDGIDDFPEVYTKTETDAKLAAKSDANHTHPTNITAPIQLQLSGTETPEQVTSFLNITKAGNDQKMPIISVFPSSGTIGDGVIFGSAGSTIIGAGEAVTQWPGKSLGPGTVSSNSEHMIISGDTNVYIAVGNSDYLNEANPSRMFVFTFNQNGNITVTNMATGVTKTAFAFG